LLAAKYFGAEDFALHILSLAVVLSGIAQFVILARRLRRRQFGLRLIKPRATTQVKTMVRRIGMGMLGGGFYQINILVGTLIASYQPGAVSWLYYSDRMIQLPFAVIGLAVGTVLLTSISDALVNKDFKKIYHYQNGALRQSMMLTLPCVAGLVALAEPMMRLLFERGAWTSESTSMVAMAMMILAFALPAMTTSQVYSRTLYAAQDVRTPVKINILTLGVSTLLMFALVGWFGYLVVPITTVIGGWMRNALSRWECKRRGLYKTLPGTNRVIFAFIMLSAAMGAGLWWVNNAGFISSIFSLLGVIAAFGVLYLPIAYFINKRFY
jgi:putative peptidoglycan lipid II flippase